MRKELLQAGYQEYPPNPVSSPYASRCYGKWIRKDGSKAYYIHVSEYEPIGPQTTQQYQASCQMNTPDMTFNVEVLSGWDLDRMEELMEKTWIGNGCILYE